jgi:hypothetical protein
MIATSRSFPGALNCLRGNAYRVAVSSATPAAAACAAADSDATTDQRAERREEAAVRVLDR